MRAALLTSLAIVAATGALAQTTAPPSAPASEPAASPATPSVSMTTPAAPPATPPAPPAVPTPDTTTDTTTAAAPAPVAAAPEAPPAPPPAPTDPVAIRLISTLETVCIPSAAGGNLAQAAKAGGLRKSGDNYATHGPGFSISVQPAGLNPGQCHVDIVHPADPQAPARTIVVALHNWAAVTRGWTLYRNDKNVTAGQEFTTRSWEHDDNGKHEALVLTTIRKADGSPMRGGADTTQLIYSVGKSAS
ncbi:MAG: hypothetical protein JOZ27_08205 [Caulobacteraceae bacterium]|nr:hypothetical protein [Caulobacteraceae bacterium]